MKSIITRSLLLVFISFVIILSIFFLNSNIFTSYQFLNSINFLIYENFGLVVLISQFIYVLIFKTLNHKDIILNTVICTIIFNLIYIFYPDYNNIVLNISNKDGLHVERAVIHQLDLLQIDFIQIFLKRVHTWDLIHYPILSSFSIMIFNISLLTVVSKKFHNYLLLKCLTFISVFMLIIYFWHHSLNSVLLLSSLLLIGVGEKIEVP